MLTDLETLIQKAKETLRREIKISLEKKTDADKIEQANLAAEFFVREVLAVEQVQKVALFSSFGNEISTLPLLKKLESRDVQVVYPKISSTSKVLEFYSGPPEVPGCFGIQEPNPHVERRVGIEEVDLFVVPGLGFGVNGERLGRGGGYYDTTLKSSKQLRSGPAAKVGFCFEEQLLDEVPMTSFDVKMDWIVTPKRVVSVQSSRKTPS